MPFSKQKADFPLDFAHRKDLAFQRFVALAKRAIDAVVIADIAGIDGREKNEAFSIDFFFDAMGAVHHLPDLNRIINDEQRRYIFER